MDCGSAYSEHVNVSMYHNSNKSFICFILISIFLMMSIISSSFCPKNAWHFFWDFMNHWIELHHHVLLNVDLITSKWTRKIFMCLLFHICLLQWLFRFGGYLVSFLRLLLVSSIRILFLMGLGNIFYLLLIYDFFLYLRGFSLPNSHLLAYLSLFAYPCQSNFCLGIYNLSSLILYM